MKIQNKGPLKIVGIAIRTSNENNQAFADIPPHWQKFFQEGVLSQINNKISEDIFAVYTNFDHKGVSSNGSYTFLIGAQVSSSENLPDYFTCVEIPQSNYMVFPSTPGKPEKVGEKWQEIWQHPFGEARTFDTEFETYHSSGEIEIFVGIKP